MNRLIPVAAAIALATAAAGCDRNKTTSTTTTTPMATAPAVTTTTTADTSSPNTATTTMAPGPAGNATGAVSETITTGKVKAAIAADSGLKDTDISVTTDNGVVMLGGTVKSQDQIAIATSLAQRQEGVNKVETQIVVR